MPDTFERLKAALADRYAIEWELGSGGMATVYLAEDRRSASVPVNIFSAVAAAICALVAKRSSSGDSF